jgi:uncharacterized protein YjbI with pentapeptide repeats
VADKKHLEIIRRGVDVWNDWRDKNPLKENIDLSHADLGKANLSEANLSGAILNGATLFRANLIRANLSGAKLSGANLIGAYLIRANLTGATLTGATLIGTQLIETNLCDAMLTGSYVYGVSVWNIKVDASTKQQNLIITDSGEPVITVDNIKVAQFIYLLLNNQEIRDVIDTITSKAVLILGRFSEERKSVLDAIRDGASEARTQLPSNYVRLSAFSQSDDP